MPNYTVEWVGTQPLQATWVDDHADGSRLNAPRRQPGYKRFLASAMPLALQLQARVNGVLGPTDLAVLSRFEWTFHQRGQGGPLVIAPIALSSSRIAFSMTAAQLGLWLLVCRRVPYRTIFTASSATDQLTLTEEPPPDGTEVYMAPGETAVLPTAVGGDLAPSVPYYVRDKVGAGPWTCRLARTSVGAAIDLTSNGSGTMALQPGRPGIDDHCGSGFLAIGWTVE